ncbi:MAG: RHS repeat domain-containing protein [Microthrixaceae bacterium]
MTRVGDATAGTVAIETQTDSLGRLLSYRDVWGKVTTSTYDRWGKVLSASNTAGTLTYEYASDDQVLSAIKLGGLSVAVPVYNSAGDMTSVSYPSAWNGVKEIGRHIYRKAKKKAVQLVRKRFLLSVFAYRHLDVSVSVCPVFGCVSAGFYRGQARVAGGVGLAVATPAVGVAYRNSTQRRSGGDDGVSNLFACAVACATHSWKGQDLRRGRVAPPSWSIGGKGLKNNLGGGYVHVWTRYL